MPHGVLGEHSPITCYLSRSKYPSVRPALPWPTCPCGLPICHSIITSDSDIWRAFLVCLPAADKWRAHETGAFGRAEIAAPLSRIPALWISARSLVVCHLVFSSIGDGGFGCHSHGFIQLQLFGNANRKSHLPSSTAGACTDARRNRNMRTCTLRYAVLSSIHLTISRHCYTGKLLICLH